MSFEPIRQLDIENYGCIKKASFALTPLHALIGPNDSGKSTTLQALRTAVRYAMRDFASEPNVKLDPKVGASPNDSSIKVGYSGGLAYGIRLSQREFPVGVVERLPLLLERGAHLLLRRQGHPAIGQPGVRCVPLLA